MDNNSREKLFIFELANNHGGNVEHGIKTIQQIAEIANKYNFNFAFKFQYRDLETFIHRDYQDRKDIKYIKRFSDTALTEEEFLTLKKTVENCGLKTMCTPFDEISVDKIIKHNYNIIKIASCSFTDWPLLEKIAIANKPVIASTAGASLEEVDEVIKFFTNRDIKLSILHCVGEYPTVKENLHLNQIDLLKKRYPEISVGFSTHEEPNNVEAIKIAIAKGASIFERHVALDTKEYPINAYSSTPIQVDAWLKAGQDAVEMCGVIGQRKPMTLKEISDLRGLKRGVFAKRDIKPGETLCADNIYFAIPCIGEQLIANDMSKYSEYTLLQEIRANQPIESNHVKKRCIHKEVLDITEKVKYVLIKSGIALPTRFEMELSHHYGIDRFYEWGATILNMINREYCKKLIVVLPQQKHPVHYHIRKEETFHVLYGDLDVVLNGENKLIREGEMLTVERKDRHSFSSKLGCIFEEISTTHFTNDSYYDDDEITSNMKRKTVMSFMFDKIQRKE